MTAGWVPREFRYTFQGFTAKYSCDGLRDRIKVVLLQLGARKQDLTVSPTGCSAGFGRPTIFPGVSVKMSVLEPLSEKSAPDIQPVAALWRNVDVSRREPLRGGRGLRTHRADQAEHPAAVHDAQRGIQVDLRAAPAHPGRHDPEGRRAGGGAGTAGTRGAGRAAGLIPRDTRRRPHRRGTEITSPARAARCAGSSAGLPRWCCPPSGAPRHSPWLPCAQHPRRAGRAAP